MTLQVPNFANDEHFLLGARDFGLDTDDAAAEIIDNSLDAGADNIHIYIEDNGEYLRMAIADDGMGIEAEIEDSSGGDPYDGLAHALSFGRRQNRPGTQIGKFGWGLSASATCQSIRTEAYTKTAEEDEFRYSYIDLDEMKETGVYKAPPQTNQAPPGYLPEEFHDLDHGTIIIFDKMDRPKRKSKNGLVSYLTRHLSRVYRHFLHGEKNIYINGTELKPYDPLYRMENAFNPGDIPLVDSPVLQERVWVEPPEGGEELPVDITLVMLDVRKIRTKDEFSSAWASKHGFNQEEQGFYLMRNDREIDNGLALGLFTKHNAKNYMRGEISFPPELDEYFGIQVNKSRFSLKDGIKDKIQHAIGNTPNQIQERTLEIQKELRAEAAEEQQETEVTMGERIAKTGDKFLRQRQHLSAKDEEDLQKELQKQKQAELEAVEEKDKLDEEAKREEKRRINQKYELATEVPFKTHFKTLGDGSFYDPELFGKQTQVRVNDQHPFYDVYQDQSDEQRAMLDLFLFSAAHAEMIFEGNPDMEQAIEQFRLEWSTALKVFLNRWDQTADDMVKDMLDD